MRVRSLITLKFDNDIAGPEVLAADPPPAAYSVETLALAVAAGALAALGAGFAAGYVCGRRCKKDEDDNMPYPDTEYEYFEQRQNINRYLIYMYYLSIASPDSSVSNAARNSNCHLERAATQFRPRSKRRTRSCA